MNSCKIKVSENHTADSGADTGIFRRRTVWPDALADMNPEQAQVFL